jgi:sugar phosphate isomerase/epimerase
LGLVIYAWGIHQRHRWEGRHAGLAASIAFLEECHALGAGGLQYPFAAEDEAQSTDFRRRLEAYGMHVEASVQPPRDAADLGRFERQIQLAKACGARVARTVLMPGRRYEQFKSLEEFRRFSAQALQSLELAEPVVRRHQLRLAVENHKDHRTPERLALLEKLSSEYIGACVDVGNNLALLENEVELARAFAPWVWSVHLKDQDLGEDPEGFLLADAALGRGCLDLPAVVKILREARPGLNFNLEVITRDPLKVPVFSAPYWTTLSDLPASQLAAMLQRVQERKGRPAFPLVSRMTTEEQLALERENVEQSLAYAQKQLGI